VTLSAGQVRHVGGCPTSSKRRWRLPRRSNGKPHNVEIYLREFKTEAVRIPHVIETHVQVCAAREITIENATVNPKLDDSRLPNRPSRCPNAPPSTMYVRPGLIRAAAAAAFVLVLATHPRPQLAPNGNRPTSPHNTSPAPTPATLCNGCDSMQPTKPTPESDPLQLSRRGYQQGEVLIDRRPHPS